MEMVNELVYVVGTIGGGDMNVTAGGLLQVLLWSVFGVETVFSVVVVGVLRDERDERAGDGGRRLDFGGRWKKFEDDHIITI